MVNGACFENWDSVDFFPYMHRNCFSSVPPVPGKCAVMLEHRNWQPWWLVICIFILSGERINRPEAWTMETEYIHQSASIYSRCLVYAYCCSVIVLDTDIHATPRRWNSIWGRQRGIAEKHMSSLSSAYAMLVSRVAVLCRPDSPVTT